MIELIIIFTLGKSISGIIRDKGRKPFKYVLLMILMWVGFEFLGAFIGAMIFGEGLIVYPFALGGAALGGYLSYNIAKNANEIEPTV